ncbi:MAG TPA: hypothetical protein VF466_04185 [Candidatus Saccharimonadales bacterium]
MTSPTPAPHDRIKFAEMPGATSIATHIANGHELISTQLRLLRALGGAGNDDPFEADGDVSESGFMEGHVAVDSRNASAARVTITEPEAAPTRYDVDAQALTLTSQELDGAGQPVGEALVHGENTAAEEALGRVYTALFALASAEV